MPCSTTFISGQTHTKKVNWPNGQSTFLRQFIVGYRLEYTYPAKSANQLTKQITITNRNGDSNSLFLLTITCRISRFQLILRLCSQQNFCRQTNSRLNLYSCNPARCNSDLFSYNIVSEMRFPNPEKIRKSVESCTSAWPFSIFDI